MVAGIDGFEEPGCGRPTIFFLRQNHAFEIGDLAYFYKHSLYVELHIPILKLYLSISITSTFYILSTWHVLTLEASCVKNLN